jgi:P4 family phage/plasmid primase-like protien
MFPQELQSLRQWLVWKFEPNGDRKPRKVPYYVNGSRRSGKQGGDDDRAALTDYATACAALNGYEGLGFAFLPGDGLVGIDLDGITESPERADRAQRIIDACQSYTEHSPSGNGVHIICRGETETFKSNILGIEVFSGRQFFTMTGQPYGEPRPLVDVSAEVFAKIKRTVRAKAHDSTAPVSAPVVSTGDKIHDALAYVSPDSGYEEWLRVGMALHSELGDGGLGVWDMWSSRSAKYPGNREVASHWRSFRSGGGITIATLYGMAKDNGWKPPRREPPPVRTPSDAPTSEPTIIDPKSPLNTARQFVAERHTDRDVATLHFWRGDWYRWAGHYYSMMEEDELKSRLYGFLERCLQYDKTGNLEPVKPCINIVGEVMAALRATQLLMIEDAPAWIIQPDVPIAPSNIIPCGNGFLIISTREVIPSTPKLFVTASLDFPVPDNPPAPAEWHRFLAGVWPDDPGSIESLAEAIGYMLTDQTDQQKAFMLVGPKRSGKGTILRIIEALVGRHNKVSPSFNSLGTDFGLAPLIGKRIAMISDARLSHRADQASITENILRITGEDSVSVNRKFKDAWNGKLPTKFLVATNELPSFSDASAALASRFIIYRFTRSFIGSEDFGLTDRIKSELPGILMWALDGLERMRTRGRLLQPVSGQGLADELEEMTSPIMQFVDDACMIGGAFSVPVSDLFTVWLEWCKDNGRDHPGTVQVFGKQLTAAFPTITKARLTDDGNRVRSYSGIRVRTSYD